MWRDNIRPIKHRLKSDITNESGISMDRLILCWSGTNHEFKGFNKSRFHFGIDNKGKYYRGKYKVDDNFDIEHSQNGYAKFVRKLNDRSISIAMIGMGDFEIIDSDAQAQAKVNNYHVTKIQYETFCTLAYHLCKIYNIPITYKTVFKSCRD